jgi:hypothetical protein
MLCKKPWRPVLDLSILEYVRWSNPKKKVFETQIFIEWANVMKKYEKDYLQLD